MPNARTHNSVANAGVRNATPNIRVANFQTGRYSVTTSSAGIQAGQAIGLLLALTYATAMNVTTTTEDRFWGDNRPSVRIGASI